MHSLGANAAADKADFRHARQRLFDRAGQRVFDIIKRCRGCLQLQINPVLPDVWQIGQRHMAQGPQPQNRQERNQHQGQDRFAQGPLSEIHGSTRKPANWPGWSVVVRPWPVCHHMPASMACATVSPSRTKAPAMAI